MTQTGIDAAVGLRDELCMDDLWRLDWDARFRQEHKLPSDYAIYMHVRNEDLLVAWLFQRLLNHSKCGPDE